MTIVNFALIGVIALILIISLITTITGEVKRKKNITKPQNQTTYNNSTQNDIKTEVVSKADVTLEKGDTVIPAQQTVIAAKNGELKPGRYSILSGEVDVESFNVRIGKYVKEYHHGDVVVIAEGEEVTPTSHKIILR